MGSREELLADAIDVVAAEASRYRTWRMQRADLHQAGVLGLIIAADRFDPVHGVPFRAFARLWVRKEIQRAIAAQEYATAIPAELTGPIVALRGILDGRPGDLGFAAAALGISTATVAALNRQLAVTAVIVDDTGDDELDLTLPNPAFEDPEEAAVAWSLTAAARRALAAMDPRAASALVLHYGLDGAGERSLREVGRQLGCSGHTARALVDEAQRRLRAILD
ncbi:sigma-70 family RNA polymerase sigma factor [Pseudonocardia sp. GCM10023141]|uniref:sigma-70 family RNA polymerase sigma factor n=1 Tax=Pseudonocardia sp. GCM10023141 TaxID=3252653 RepID=UPI00362148E6